MGVVPRFRDTLKRRFAPISEVAAVRAGLCDGIQPWQRIVGDGMARPVESFDGEGHHARGEGHVGGRDGEEEAGAILGLEGPQDMEVGVVGALILRKTARRG